MPTGTLLGFSYEYVTHVCVCVGVQEVGKTKASSRKSIKRGPWLGLRSPMEDEVSSGLPKPPYKS